MATKTRKIRTNDQAYAAGLAEGVEYRRVDSQFVAGYLEAVDRLDVRDELQGFFYDGFYSGFFGE